MNTLPSHRPLPSMLTSAPLSSTVEIHARLVNWLLCSVLINLPSFPCRFKGLPQGSLAKHASVVLESFQEITARVSFQSMSVTRNAKPRALGM
jgi:hypothetical protein